MSPPGPHAEPIRVLLLCERLDIAGGVERFVCGLANHLSRQGMQVAVGSVDTPASALRFAVDTQVTVLAGRPAHTEARTEAPTERKGLLRHAQMLAAQWRTGRSLAGLIRTHAPDVVLLNGLTTACSVLALHPACAARTICCDHNHFAARSRVWRWLRAWLYPKVAAVVSLTEADAPKFRALNPRTRVIRNASALPISPPALPAAPTVLAVGRFVAQKGFDLLLCAWRDVVQALPEARLRIVGDGPLGAALQRQALSLGIAGQVEWLPPTPHIESRYREAAVFVLPSRYEGMPLVLLEAQACGVPAVAFDCPTGPREIVSTETGIVVPAQDVGALARALVMLLRDAPQRERMAHAAHRRSRELFGPEAHGQAWTALVREVAAMTGAEPQPVPRLGEAAIPLRSDGRARCVSVIVPCRNERAHIAAFCASVARQVLPEGWTLQVLVADGLSDDGTRDVLASLAAAEPRLQTMENPKRIVSAGLNLALARARGEVIVRMDVHTEYAADYLAQCIAVLAETGADNVGGPWRAEPPAGAGATAQAVAATFQSRWVAGGALSRRLDHEGRVDTVYLGCWPRATFERFGGFDESLVRNQDDEHNLRIVRGGGRVWQSPRIRSVYRPRGRLAQVFRQYLQYGYWKPFVMKKHGQPASLRQLVPGAYVLLQAVLLLAWAFGAPAWLALGLGAAYASIVAAMTALVLRSGHLNAAAALRVPGVIVAHHFGYGLGFVAGTVDAFRRGGGRSRFASLSR